MTSRNADEPLKLGTLVKFRDSGHGPGRIVEFRGALGPGGMRIYRVRVRGKPRPGYIEVREDQLEEAEPGA
jgi:hypothetical protein